MARRRADAKSDSRPWGEWRILLEAPSYKVKRIAVKPGHRLSYQTHARRQEHWTVVQGEALVTLDGKDLRLTAGQCAAIPKGAAHRARNPGERDLVIIEVQTGEYFGEDDIVRLEDDYGRTD
ncbi:MAG: phosphomannose isomerase type II C-terminal cupin domain [Elusimicrobiota bacterium]